MEVKSKTIGIIGGMGPEATLDLCSRIIKHTPAQKDQDHIHLIIDNYPQIPDRTAFILGKGENPLPYILKSVDLLVNCGVDALCMPCNTAHYFVEDIRKHSSTPFISIIESVLKEVRNNYSEVKNIGLLATRGVIVGRVYHQVFENDGFKIVTPSESVEDVVMDVIYSVKAGTGREKVYDLQMCIDSLKEKGCELIIAGCTEIPILLPFVELPVPVVDSTLSLAKEVVSFAFKK